MYRLRPRSVTAAETLHVTTCFTIGKELLKCLSLDQMKDAGALFIPSKTAFTIPYLEMTYLRLLRGKLSPGQEGAVVHLHHNADHRLPSSRRLRELLLRALEAYAVARRSPSVPMQFNLGYQASHIVKLNKVLSFPPTQTVNAISFDGHFGPHRKPFQMRCSTDSKAQRSSDEAQAAEGRRTQLLLQAEGCWSSSPTSADRRLAFRIRPRFRTSARSGRACTERVQCGQRHSPEARSEYAECHSHSADP